MRYAGAIYLDRDPTPLFRAARRVIDRLALTPADFRIELMGTVTRYGGRDLSAIAADERVADYLTLKPPGPRAEALRFMSSASMLVSLPQDIYWAIPSKIFEYMRFPATILALTVAGSAIDTVLGGTGADVAEPTDVDAIAAILERRYREHRQGARPQPIASAYPRFSRRAQAEELFEELDRLIGR
jgi:hypothetical protein